MERAGQREHVRAVAQCALDGRLHVEHVGQLADERAPRDRLQLDVRDERVGDRLNDQRMLARLLGAGEQLVRAPARHGAGERDRLHAGASPADERLGRRPQEGRAVDAEGEAGAARIAAREERQRHRGIEGRVRLQPHAARGDDLLDAPLRDGRDDRFDPRAVGLERLRATLGDVSPARLWRGAADRLEDALSLAPDLFGGVVGRQGDPKPGAARAHAVGPAGQHEARVTEAGPGVGVGRAG